MEESVVRGGVGELLPGVTSNGMQETTDEEGHGRRLYSFTYEGVTFTTDVTRRGEADFAYESDLLRLNFAAGPSVLEEDGGSENGIKNVIIVLSF